MNSRSLEERILEWLRASRAWCDAGTVAIALDFRVRDTKALRNVRACMQRLTDRKVLEFNANRASVYYDHYRLAPAKVMKAKGAKAKPAAAAPQPKASLQRGKPTASDGRTIAQRILDAMPTAPRALCREEIALAIGAEQEGIKVAVVGARISDLTERGFLKAEGKPRFYRWSRTSKPASALLERKPAAAFRISTPAPPKPAAPKAMVPQTEPAAQTARVAPGVVASAGLRSPPPAPMPAETVEQFLARGGHIQTLPGFGWQRDAELDHSRKGRTDARVRAGLEPHLAGTRRDTLDDQDAETESVETA